jgi:hypothetical protein
VAAARSNLLINGVSNWFLFHRRSPGQQSRFRTTGGGEGGTGSGPVGVVAADAADAAGHRRRRQIFKKTTNQVIKGYNKDTYGYTKVMIFGYQYGYDRIHSFDMYGYIWIPIWDNQTGYHIWILKDTKKDICGYTQVMQFG